MGSKSIFLSCPVGNASLCFVVLSSLFVGRVPHKEVASAMGRSHAAIEAAEAVVGGRYRWATEFENIHSSWTFEEPGFYYADVHWKGSEQLYQCLKWGSQFHEHKRDFAQASEMEAYALGRVAKVSDDWDNGGKLSAMKLALSLKFRSSPKLKALLLETGDDPLVSIKADTFWGMGFDGKGVNMLAKMLQDLRTELRLPQ